MKKRNMAALLLVMTLSISTIISACGSSTVSTTATETEAISTSATEADSDTDRAEITIKDQSVTGEIIEIEGSDITLEISISSSNLSMPGGAMDGQGNQDTPPDMPEGLEGASEENGDTPPDAPQEQEGTPEENGDTPPDMPQEQEGTPEENGDTPPDMPQDQNMGGFAGENNETLQLIITLQDNITSEDFEASDSVTITFDENGAVTDIEISENAMSMGGMGGGMGTSSAPADYTALNTYTTDSTEDGQTYESTGTDENAILISEGASVTISNAKIIRNSEDSTGGDNASFYGVGASVLNTDGTLVIKDSTITSDAAGGAGVFSYGDGVTYVYNTTITTTENTSGGIHVAGGGTLYAWDLDVETSGTSAAAIRSDRGSGTMVVDGGTYISNGADSPAVYCTADIAINDATLISNGAEGVCIEGLNSLYLFDSDLTSSMTSDSRNDVIWNIIVYQSMSGDSEEGNGTFSMIGGSITASEGGLFYTTNTESTFYLNDVDITYPEDNQFFLRATGNSNERGWGQSGANGADTSFTADDQDMEGDIITDSISNLDFCMMNGSTLTGAFVRDESSAGNDGSGETNVYISADSTWTVTGDSIITNLYCEGTIVDADGNTVTIIATDGSVLVSGDSQYTITVDNYETTADFSAASTAADFSDFAVEKI